MYYQQGDVLIKKVMSLPEGAKKQNNLILAEGEATGHHHEVQGNLAEKYLFGDEIFLNVLETSEITHQEHNSIQIDPGVYQVGIVREYDHFEEEARRVID